MSWTAIAATAGGAVEPLAAEAEVEDALAREDRLVWVHCVDLDDTDARMLRTVFGLHPLAIEDCQGVRYRRPKVEEYTDYLFVILHGIDATETRELVTTKQVGLFLGTRFVVTATVGNLPPVAHLRALVTSDPRPCQHGAAMLAHAILDAVIDSVLPTVDRMEEVATELEDAVLARPAPAHLAGIQQLKRSALRVHRAMAPQHTMLAALGHGRPPWIDERSALYFRDVGDHVLRIEDLNGGLRERADNMLATYLSTVSLRQNESMRALSLVATIFLPLTLIAGIYGMNFEHMPELGWSWGYYGVLGVMAVVIVGVLWAFWARHWVGRGGRRIVRAVHFSVEDAVLHEVLTEASRLRHATFWPRR